MFWRMFRVSQTTILTKFRVQSAFGAVWRMLLALVLASLFLEVSSMTISYFPGPVLPDSPQDSIRQQHRDQLRHSILEFLRATSSKPPSGFCSRCGQKMQHIAATFSLYGSDTQWKVQLPVCSCSHTRVSESVEQGNAAGKSDHKPHSSSA